MKFVRLRRVRLAVAVALALGLVGAGLLAGQAAAHPSHAPQNWHVQVGAQSREQAIQTMAFYPAHLWINQGDSVTWTANAAEIHTVTFFAKADPCPPTVLCALPPGGFDPGDPRQSTPQGTNTYDGTSYYNSGVMSSSADPGPLPPFVVIQREYTLSFPDTLPPGDYGYICLVHGQLQQGTITVRPKETPYPFTQRDYDHQASKAEQADIADGYKLWHQTGIDAAKLNETNGPTILIGAMDQRALVMRFTPSELTVKVGDKVSFMSNALDTPHTVTFGDENGCGAPPCDPTAPWNVTQDPDGNLAADYPGNNGGFTGDPGNLNTGIMLGLPPAETGLPADLTLTTTEAGRFGYICALHDSMGMRGNLSVVG